MVKDVWEGGMTAYRIGSQLSLEEGTTAAVVLQLISKLGEGIYKAKNKRGLLMSHLISNSRCKLNLSCGRKGKRKTHPASP
jgi:hypothetical protein